MKDLGRTYVSTDDFAAAARRRLPRIFADYIDGGAFSETTMRRNRAEFERFAIRQRVLVPIEATDLSTKLGTERVARPFGIGPVGFMGLYRRNGDVLAAKAAAAAGIPFALSTFSINGLGTIAEATGRAPDFQLYVDQDPDVTAAHLAACREHGVGRIFLTVDTAITSVRERDVRNGFRAVERLTPGLFWQFAQRPGWSIDLLRNGFPEVELVRGRPEFGKGALAQAGNLSRRLEKRLSWETVEKLREDWGGELVVKGLTDPEDAARAAALGADGIGLSNHGGRQLDHGLSTLGQISTVRSAIGPGCTLFVDSGFRRGSDIFKAIALGADVVLMGRPFAWAVAAEGQAGVEHLIGLLSTELEISLNLAGLSSVAELRSAGEAGLVALS